MLDYLKERFKERSTWIAIFALFSAFFGKHFAPEQQDAIQMLAIALLGGGHIFSKG